MREHEALLYGQERLERELRMARQEKALKRKLKKRRKPKHYEGL